MANEIFYTVSKSNSHTFATNEASKKVIGFITPDAGETFGYLVANGKQFGPSNADILEMVKNNTLTEKKVEQMISTSAPQVTVDAANNAIIGNGGTKYTLSIKNGQLSVSKYEAVKLAGINTTVTATVGSGADASNSGAQFLGTSYVLHPTLTVDTYASAQSIKYRVTNTTGNSWVVTGIKSGSTYLTGAAVTISNGTISGANYVTNAGGEQVYVLSGANMISSPASSSAVGTVQWAAANSKTISAASKTVTIYLHEKGTSSLLTATATLTASPSSATQTVSTKAYWYKKNGAITNSSKGTATEVVYPNKFNNTAVTFEAGELPSIAYPAAWGNTLQILFLGSDTVASAWNKPTSTTTINGVPYYVYTKKGTVADKTEYKLSV